MSNFSGKISLPPYAPDCGGVVNRTVSGVIIPVVPPGTRVRRITTTGEFRVTTDGDYRSVK
jgi:hypothetical protein